MRIPLLTAAALAASLAGAASAQTDGGQGAERGPRADGLINQKYLAPTGETVPHPGVSQGPGVTPLDRGIQMRDDKVQRSICSNC